MEREVAGGQDRLGGMRALQHAAVHGMGDVVGLLCRVCARAFCA